MRAVIDYNTYTKIGIFSTHRCHQKYLFQELKYLLNFVQFICLCFVKIVYKLIVLFWKCVIQFFVKKLGILKTLLCLLCFTLYSRTIFSFHCDAHDAYYINLPLPHFRIIQYIFHTNKVYISYSFQQSCYSVLFNVVSSFLRFDAFCLSVYVYGKKNPMFLFFNNVFIIYFLCFVIGFRWVGLWN